MPTAFMDQQQDLKPLLTLLSFTLRQFCIGAKLASIIHTSRYLSTALLTVAAVCAAHIVATGHGKEQDATASCLVHASISLALYEIA